MNVKFSIIILNKLAGRIGVWFAALALKNNGNSRRQSCRLSVQKSSTEKQMDGPFARY